MRAAAQARRLSRRLFMHLCATASFVFVSRLEKGADIEQRIRTVDGERAKYIAAILMERAGATCTSTT
jgi:hypothetical protein